MGRRGLLAVCALAVTLLSSCSSGAGRPGAGSSATPERAASRTPTPASDPASDGRLLSFLLGPTVPDCNGAPPGNRTCGRLLAASAKLVDGVRIALEDMPKSAEYTKVSDAVAGFQESYKRVDGSGCYTRQGKAFGTDKKLSDFCTVLASGVALSWLNLQTAISDLGKSG